MKPRKSHFSTIFLIWLIFIGLIHDSTQAKSSVAVCVSGHMARWLPEFLLTGLIEPNSRFFNFYLFFNLEYINTRNISALFQKQGEYNFGPSAVNFWNSADLFRSLHMMYRSKSSQIASIEFRPRKKLVTWKKQLKRALNRISQFADNQQIILNLYAHQMACAEQIELFEEHSNLTMDYIVLTREDLYFIKPLYLQDVLPRTFPKDIATTIMRSPLLNQTNKDYDYCHLNTKNCLNWGGVEMRFEIFDRRNIDIIRNRLKFYLTLYNPKYSVFNPESFERHQLHTYGLNYCEFPPDYFPVIPARYVPFANKPPVDVSADRNLPLPATKICITPLEVRDNCFPAGTEPYLKSFTCDKFLNTSNASQNNTILESKPPTSPQESTLNLLFNTRH